MSIQCPDFQGWGVKQTFLLLLLEICLRCWVLEFLQTEPDPYVALAFHPLETESEGYHYKLTITFDIGSWKTTGLSDVHTWLEASFDHDVVDLIMVVSSCPVPCPASRWFVWIKCVHHLQVVVTGEFQEPQASFVGLRVAILATCPLSVLACILSYLCFPVALHYNDVFLWRLVYDFLHLIIEVFNVINIVVSCWVTSLDDGDVKRWYFKTNGNESARDWSASRDSINSVFVNEESNSMLMSVFIATEEELVAFWVRPFSKFSPSYSTESKDVPSVCLHSKCLWWCCFWHVAILVHQSHTFHLRPDSQQRKARSLFWATIEPVWIELWLSSSCGVSWAMSYGGAHPSPCQSTADALNLGGSPWSLTHSRWVSKSTSSSLARNLHCGGHSPGDVVLTSPPHVV